MCSEIRLNKYLAQQYNNMTGLMAQKGTSLSRNVLKRVQIRQAQFLILHMTELKLKMRELYIQIVKIF